MKQFILSAPPDTDGLVRISGADFHYLAHVRRLKSGDRFTARTIQGDVVEAEVCSVEDAALTVKLVPPAKAGGGAFSALPPIVLFQALPKGAKMDLIVRQAAEGGLTEVVPFAAEHSVPKLADWRDRQGGRRWERIIREALQQSGSPVMTTLHPPLDGEGLFAYWNELRAAHPGALGIFFHTQDVSLRTKDGEGPRQPLAQASFHEYLSDVPDILVLAVGPEGGFSPAEAARFIAEGFKPLKIGETVLRTETAALYGAAAARIILLESASWTTKPR
jgi:16S rRNA (uracil1498-N3)-methyltransferase